MCGRSGSKTDSSPLQELGAQQICAPALDKSAALRYIIRYKCSAKECARVVPLQQAGGGCKPGTVRRVLSLSSRRGERGFSPASRARGCRRYQGRRACRPAAKRPDRATGWYRDLSFSGRPMINHGAAFLFCPNVKITPRTFTRRFTLCRRNSPNSMPAGHRGSHLSELVRQGVFPYPDRPQQKTVYHRHAAAERHRPAAHGPRHG